MKKEMTLLGLVAATYFMVSGGPYGLEDLIAQTGYGWGILILCLVPFLWALPTAMMVGELASAIPRGFLYLGATCPWKILGIPGSLAFISGFHI